MIFQIEYKTTNLIIQNLKQRNIFIIKIFNILRYTNTN